MPVPQRPEGSMPEEPTEIREVSWCKEKKEENGLGRNTNRDECVSGIECQSLLRTDLFIDLCSYICHQSLCTPGMTANLLSIR